MKIIVTGGAGFIGSHIVDALIDKGHEVHVIDNLCNGKKKNVNSEAQLHIVDIRNKNKLIPIFKNARYVFHEAALPRVQYSIENPIETNEVNVDGFLNVLEACRINKIKRLIFASSGSVYGNTKVLPMKENTELTPLSPYATQKYIGEIYSKLYSEIYGLETVNLRYFNVYGPRMDPDGSYPLAIGCFIKMMQNGKLLPVTGDGKQTRDYTHVKDVVRANLLAIKSSKVGRGECLNIGSGKKYTINYIASLFGGKIKYIPARLEPRNTLADIKKARRLLNWKPKVSIEEGIKELKKLYNLK